MTIFDDIHTLQTPFTIALPDEATWTVHCCQPQFFEGGNGMQNVHGAIQNSIHRLPNSKYGSLLWLSIILATIHSIRYISGPLYITSDNLASVIMVKLIFISPPVYIWFYLDDMRNKLFPIKSFFILTAVAGLKMCFLIGVISNNSSSSANQMASILVIITLLALVYNRHEKMHKSLIKLIFTVLSVVIITKTTYPLTDSGFNNVALATTSLALFTKIMINAFTILIVISNLYYAYETKKDEA